MPKPSTAASSSSGSEVDWPHPFPVAPRVSVGVPVYNGEAFLRQTLDSLLAQTFRDFELIIADNASTDGTAAICQEYAGRDSRIRYVRNEVNIGANPNFNRLVALARAPYFKLANADDLCHPELLARCVSVLDHHPEAVLCYARAQLIDEQGHVIRDHDDNLDLRSSRASDRFRAVFERLGLVNVHQGVIRTDVLRKVPRMAAYPGADGHLVAELALHGEFYEVPDRLFFRRMHTGASSGLTTLEEVQALVDPSRTAPSFLTVHAHIAYLTALVRAPLSLHERLAVTHWVIRSLLWRRRTLGREILHFLGFSRGRPRRREQSR
jgi:glycosyltransferase involved in cell wall biosynthesis